MKQTTWHWPDHVIGKRESRRLREEHNALANSHHELVVALGDCIAVMESELRGLAVIQPELRNAKLVYSKAKEVGHDS